MKSKTIFSFAILLVMSLLLSACRLEAPKAGKGNSGGGGQTTSRPGDTPSVGDAGGAGKVMSSPEEIKEEIERAWKFFQQGGIGASSKITTFHNMLYTLLVLKKAIQPNTSSDRGWTTDSLTEEYLRQSLKSDSLLRHFVSQISNEEELLRQMMTHMHELANEVDPEGAKENQRSQEDIFFRTPLFSEHDPAWAPSDSKRLFKLFRLYLENSELSFDMLDCAPDLNHKVAAVSSHSRGAKVCFNLAKLGNVPKYLLHQELHGYILHEFLHLIGYKEEDVAKVHALYNITIGFSQEVSHILAVQGLANGLRKLAASVLRESVRFAKLDPKDQEFANKEQFDLISNADRSGQLVGEINRTIRYLFEFSTHPEIKRIREDEIFGLSSLLDGAHVSCSGGQKSCSLDDIQRASTFVAAHLFEMQLKVLSLSLPDGLVEQVNQDRPLYVNVSESAAGGVDFLKRLEGEHVHDTFGIATGRSPMGFGSVYFPRRGDDGEQEFRRDSFDFSRMKFITQTVYDMSKGLFLDEEHYQKALEEQKELDGTPVFYKSVFQGSYRDIFFGCVVDSRVDF